ncbi:MAG TPA: hypothetical protein VFZ53_16325 [Polyangiaceae bacterium]
MKAHARALFAGVLCLLWSAVARAEGACGRPGKPWVSVEFGSGAWPESLRASVLGDLRVGLARHGIDACPEGAGPNEPKLAAVRIAWLEDPRVVVTVEIKDSVTQKRVSRDVDLSSVPSDGRGFAIAIATDELVWATWVELALAPRATTPKRSVPPEVVAGIEAELPHEPESRLGVAGALEHFGGGQTHFGADAMLFVPLPERFSLDARLGVRAGRDTASEHGSVLSQALGAAAHLRYALVRASALELTALAGARVALLGLEGEANPGANDAAASRAVVTARAGVASSLELARGLWVELGGTAGYALRGFEVTDEGNVVSGATGTELGASLGLLVEL